MISPGQHFAPREAVAQAVANRYRLDETRSATIGDDDRVVADAVLNALRALPVEQRMEAMGMVPQVLRLAGQRAWVAGPDVH